MISKFTGKKIRKVDPDLWEGKSRAFVKKIRKHHGNIVEFALAIKKPRNQIYAWIEKGSIHMPRMRAYVKSKGVDPDTLEFI